MPNPKNIKKSSAESESVVVSDETVPTQDTKDFDFPAPCKENTLYLTIKQCYFDEIAAGTKDKEYREIKETTYKKYLDCTPDGTPYWDDCIITLEELVKGDIWVWNNGKYPFYPKESIYYLHLAVGYAKERDTMLVEVSGFSFEPVTNPSDNKPARFFDKEHSGQVTFDDNGDHCFWMIVFHLGKIIEINRK